MLTFLVLNGAALWASALAARAVDAASARRAFALRTVCGYLLLIHSAMLGAGLIGWLTPRGLTAAVLLALGGALALSRRSRACAGAWTEGAAPMSPAGARREGDRAMLPAAVLIVAAVTAGATWAWPHLFGATRLWIWDDYTYHMVYPTLWLRQGAIAAVPPFQAFTMQAWYPLSADLVAAWFMAPFAGARADALAWVSLTALVYGGIVVCAIGELTRRLGCRPEAWALAVTLVVTSARIDVMASSFSDADLAHAATLFAALAFATPRSDAEETRGVIADAVFAALLAGFAIGVKISAVPVAVVVFAMLIVRAGTPAARARVAMIALTSVLATGAYWYIRNVVHTGNPVYPAMTWLSPGATFPATTLREYAAQYGLVRALRDAADVYLSWPRLHGLLAGAGLVALAAWRVGRRRTLARPQASFATAALAVTALVLVTLPGTPYSAGNPMTFAAGFVHWDSMRYVALLALLGWVALAVVIDAGRTADARCTVAALAVTGAALYAGGSVRPLALFGALLAIAVAAWRPPVWLQRVWRHPVWRRPAWAPTAWRRAVWWKPTRIVRHPVAVAAAAGSLALAVLVTTWHRPKAVATEAAVHREPLIGAAAVVLDAEPPGTRVAIFGDQWVYPTFGARHHLEPVRLDGDGRLAAAPIGAAYEPGDLAVDPPTFRANLARSGVAIVVVLRLPHPGRSPRWPTQTAALDAVADVRVLYRNAWLGVWRVGD